MIESIGPYADVISSTVLYLVCHPTSDIPSAATLLNMNGRGQHIRSIFRMMDKWTQLSVEGMTTYCTQGIP